MSRERWDLLLWPIACRLLGWTPVPGTALYAGYTADKTAFVKAAYKWSINIPRMR